MPLARQHNQTDALGVTKDIRVCIGCDKCWQRVRKPGILEPIVEYYEDFPTYGLARERCKTCKSKIEDDLKDMRELKAESQ